ncbi:Acetyltransferase (GNAT) domain-containing protein [Noviherbaspirillum suwonense]|uniref:Acetyltransferase (GNAT) domain-containing protein n=2 Tax=Noviherbaspirillum suwonense TaxID=1224511 RepID=A0ABY1PWR0_9BURK|nr:Acetyltransferase (GNAT) domain-containing protein [Noviherbaspirillum suwonense]
MREPADFSPLVASAWADAIIAFWQSASVQGRLDPTQPLEVLDLMPGSGESVRILMRALEQRMAMLPGFAHSLRYLMVGHRRDSLTPTRWQSELQPSLQAEKLVTVLWDPGRGDPCLLRPGKRSAWKPINPVAVIAHDSWAKLGQRLCAVHYGRLLEADICRLSKCTTPAEEAGEWRPLQTGRVADRVTSLMEGCLSKFNSAPVPLPIGAIDILERIASLASNGYLVLAAAPGLVSERHIRLHQFSDLLAHYRRYAEMPVNFYLLSQYVGVLGGVSWQSELRPDYAVQAAVGNLPDPKSALSVAVATLKFGAASDAPSLVEAARAVGAARGDNRLNVLLALIRRSEFDPAVFSVAASSIMDDLRTSSRVERAAWVDALERTWSNHLPSAHAPAQALHRKLAPAAMRVGAWRLARAVLSRGMQIHGEQALDLAHLAWCEMRTGQGNTALALIRRAAILNGNDPTVREVMQTVEGKMQGWDANWKASVSSHSLPLAIEPLDVGHAEAFWHQYRDPQIAFMTGLQTLSTLDATRKWILEHVAEPGRKPYALMHREYGFVGYVCLSVSAHEAYFCFWIGADFQGSGFSIESARLLFDLAKRQGVLHVFTSAYQDNARSIAALEKTGFSRIDIRALPPENDRVFFFLNLSDVSVRDQSERLITYYEREKLPLYFPGQETRQQADRAAMQAAVAVNANDAAVEAMHVQAKES